LKKLKSLFFQFFSWCFMGDIEDVISFLRSVGVIKGNTVSYDGLVHYGESISIILNLPPEEAGRKVLDYLVNNGYIMVR